MVKWLLLPVTTRTSTATTMTITTLMSAQSFLTIIFVIASLVRAINGFQPVPMNGEGRALAASGTDARKLFGGYRITPKTCRATKTLPSSDPRSKGPTICMFNHECAQRNGEVVGACMDGFLFGACCQIPNKQDIESTLINDAQNAYFQQYQQHKLQMQQSMSNPAAAQSYENYGESAQQQSAEVASGGSGGYKKPPKSSTGNFQSTTTHQFISSSNSNSYKPATNSPASSTTNIHSPSSTTVSSQEVWKNEAISSTQSESQSESAADSSSTENVAHILTKTSSRPSNAAPVQQPPKLHVHKDSVKISSPSSPPHNDDFVMQVLSTLPPDHDNDQITFTTEVPMKIASHASEQQSSESNSFEEPAVTQIPVQLVEKPVKNSEQTKTPQLRPQSEPQPQHQQHKQTLSTNHQHDEQQHTNMHHHNHLLLDANEFTHSGIEHAGADADVLEDDLQFSTGYGPQPSFANAPSYISSSTSKTPQPEDKYVLVQTISNDPGYNKQQPITSGNPTTSSSITTHVDSIESIILQLNNSNHGPVYSVINQAEPATSASYQSNNVEADKQSSYSPSYSPTTESSAPYFEEIETKRPTDDNKPDKYAAMTPQVPAYLEPVTTNLNYIPQNEYAADAMAESSSFGPSSYKPIEESAAPSATYGDDAATAGYNDHTMPDKNYNDAAGTVAHQTSEFNKMPAMGIAYPVDMSYMDEEGNIITEEGSSFQKLSTQQSTSQKLASSSTSSYQSPNPDAALSHTRLPEVNQYESLKPSKRPIASYIGVVTAPTHQPQLGSNYNKVPEEVSVTSHTTKVHEENDSSPSYQTPQTQKFTTINYVESAATTPKPKPSTLSHASSPGTVQTRPPYDSLVLSSSTAKPKPAKASKRPGQNKKKTSKPQASKKPSTSYTQSPQNSYQQQGSKAPSTSYTQSPQNNFEQEGAYKKPTTHIQTTTAAYSPRPVSVYNQRPSESSYQSTTEHQSLSEYDAPKQPEAPPRQPSNQYGAEEALPAYTPPKQPLVSYNQAQHISSPTTTRKPSTVKKPISTSYVTGPSSPRPPSTFAYDNEVPPLLVADDKLDSFIHSTAEGLANGSPAPILNFNPAPVYANAVTPLQVQHPANTYNTHKKPGFVKIKPTARPPVPTVHITPKPTTNSYVKQPSGDSYYPSTTPMPAFASTSYVYSPTITRRPEYDNNTPSYVSLPPITSNDFDDPGYYGGQSASGPQSVTQATYAVPSDDRPAFPGYFGPTPTYPAFQIPGEKNDGSIEETYTSPNDFANFPPVRHPNPNLNMSVTSSAVTSDLELSTPAFVEDGVLKDKMNTLVHKIVESLQGNFEALADMIDETVTPQTYQASSTYTTKPTRKPTTTKPKATTKKPNTTKPPTKKPTATTRKPVSKRTTTRKPVTTRRPTKKPTPTTTNAAPFQDEIIDEEDGEDISPSENEIDQSETLSGSSRKIQCGVRPHVKSGRIVGGKGSTFGAYPWQVLVRESTWLGLFTKNKCGGVLITSKYVITAAHCQPGFLASLVAVLGEFDISGDLESKKATTKNVKRVIVHRQYDPATFENDLALLELDSPVQFDTHIVPICMPSDLADFTGRMATVTGWGRLKYGGGVPSVLQEVQVPIIENSVCQEMFHTAGHNKKIINSFLCAGYANGQKDSCEGDSGGPLVLQRPDGRYELAGTVSHGIKCAAPYLPGVYMRTTYYKPWLRAITGVK